MSYLSGHPYNHFAVFRRLNQKQQNFSESVCAACVTSAWNKIRAKNNNIPRLWLVEIGDRVARVDGSISRTCQRQWWGNFWDGVERIKSLWVFPSVQAKVHFIFEVKWTVGDMCCKISLISLMWKNKQTLNRKEEDFYVLDKGYILTTWDEKYWFKLKLWNRNVYNYYLDGCGSHWGNKI